MKQQLTRLSLLLFLLSSITSYAQVQWFTPDANWDFQITSGWIGQGVEHISIGTSTVQHNGKTFQGITRNFQYLNGSQDINTRYLLQEGSKIYGLNEGAPGGPQSFLMYDFDLEVGDRVELPKYGITGELAYIVVKTDFIQVLGEQRRLQEVNWIVNNKLVPNSKSSFIEGLGNIEGLHLIGAAWCLSPSYLFLDEPPALSVDGADRNFCSYTSALGSYEGIAHGICQNILENEEPEHNLSVQITPNPSHGEIRVSSRVTSNMNYQLTDLNGQLLAEGGIDGLPIHSDYQGLALLKLTQEGQTSIYKVLFIRD